MVVKGTTAAAKVQCDMRVGCSDPVTHIGAKGYVYCAEHVFLRKGYERCRKMRKWELDLLSAGKPLPSYKPIRKPKVAAGDSASSLF